MKKVFWTGVFASLISVFSFASQARYESRFEVINFDPAIDGGPYLTVYGAETLNAWQGNMGFYIDYANRPLQIFVNGAGGGRQSIIDHITVVDLYGSLGFTDWFEAGLNIPVVAYNWFFTDDAAVDSDHAAGMGDIEFMAKFRIVDIEKHKIGFALVPYVTAPTGDTSRYTGNGALTGGLTAVLEAKPFEKFNMALNLGADLRDEVNRTVTVAGGASGTIGINDTFTYGVGANYQFNKNWQGIVDVHGYTVIENFFGNQDTSPIEVDGAIRYAFNDSGFSATLGGGAGIMRGIGNPRFRAFAGLNWTSPLKEAPVVAAPAPDPRIVENKIILMGKIFYDTAKSKIKPESYPILDDVVDVLNKNQQVGLVEIQGHCDARGGDQYNQKLSDARASSAMNYLAGKGVNPSRLTAKGYGESQPVASNDTPEGMAQNRRTEFVILEQGGQAVPPSSHYIPSEPVNQVVPATVTEPVTINRVPASVTPVSSADTVTESLDAERENQVNTNTAGVYTN